MSAQPGAISAGVTARERPNTPCRPSAAERDGLEARILKVAQCAVDLGADVNARNYAGDTALHHAAAKGFNTVIQFLVDKGARLDAKNKRAQTPASIAEAGSRNVGDGSPSLASTAELLRTLSAK